MSSSLCLIPLSSLTESGARLAASNLIILLLLLLTATEQGLQERSWPRPALLSYVLGIQTQDLKHTQSVPLCPELSPQPQCLYFLGFGGLIYNMAKMTVFLHMLAKVPSSSWCPPGRLHEG